ncbi:MAG: cobalamin B12-binding domain-containing protein [Chloroflexota bacterium]
MERKIRVLIAKPGLDGHDVGAKIMTYGLRDNGMEVIYSGLRQTPEAVAEAAVQESVDVIGLSCLSGAHKYLLPRVVELIKEKGMDHVLVIAGGTIPPEDIPYLKEHGIAEVFIAGTSVQKVVNYIKEKMTATAADNPVKGT